MYFSILLSIILCICFVNGLNNGTSCIPLRTQKNTSTILTRLRQEMRRAGIGIYVVFSDDEHGSEYTQPFDKRRDYITGFHGSAGIAIITQEKAALWTDSRYFTEAEEELDCANWLLMRDGQPGVLPIINWLVNEANQTALPPGTTTVFTSAAWWSVTNNVLETIGKQLQSVDDLVERIWSSNERPKQSQQKIVQHDIRYAGEDVSQKLNRTATEMKRVGVAVTVISALDEIAWQFNLRGADIPYNPFFKSYAIIYADYVKRPAKLFVNLTQINIGDYPKGVTVLDYSTFWSHLNSTAADSSVNRIYISARVSQAIIALIPPYKRPSTLSTSLVQRVKARKNSIERQGMRDCQIRDAVARLKHLGWIEQQLENGKIINETQSADQLLIYQKQQDKFKFPSFEAISASGDRAAVVHYRPNPATARQITKDKIYLLDAGSQYLDCTTDITRTHHFGIAKPLEKRAYTRVLQGVLEIADTIFPVGTYGRSIDHLGRMYLYRDGMTFGHGIGHGIGHFLAVHEGPQRIGAQYSQYEEPLADGMFISDEPGFYKPDDFGIRIENDMEVVMSNLSVYDMTQFLRFNTITFLPYERSLIDTNLLTSAQIKTIDDYHLKIFELLQPLVKSDQAAFNALRSRTEKLINPKLQTLNNASTNINSLILMIFLNIFYYFL